MTLVFQGIHIHQEVNTESSIDSIVTCFLHGLNDIICIEDASMGWTAWSLQFADMDVDLKVKD